MLPGEVSYSQPSEVEERADFTKVRAKTTLNEKVRIDSKMDDYRPYCEQDQSEY